MNFFLFFVLTSNIAYYHEYHSHHLIAIIISLIASFQMCYFSTLFFLHTIKSTTPLKIALRHKYFFTCIKYVVKCKCIYNFWYFPCPPVFSFQQTDTINIKRNISNHSHKSSQQYHRIIINRPLSISTSFFFLAPKMHFERNHLPCVFIVILTLWFFTSYELSIIHTSPVRPFILRVPRR